VAACQLLLPIRVLLFSDPEEMPPLTPYSQLNQCHEVETFFYSFFRPPHCPFTLLYSAFTMIPLCLTSSDVGLRLNSPSVLLAPSPFFFRLIDPILNMGAPYSLAADICLQGAVPLSFDFLYFDAPLSSMFPQASISTLRLFS